ncbi:acyl carrier protein [Micromonospora sediminicola]|uniref:acyl carrier protein n=1 Tax=Micromonospora sediminicola TaxID=946078 RepID=UPI000A6D9CF6|nr:acyl carrier protein [Micromonospora sediminicola]
MTNRAAEQTVGRSEAELVDRVLAIVREVLSRPDLGPDDEVMDFGGTSLSILRILAETKRVLDLNVNPRDLNGAVTAHNLVRAAR